MSRRAWPARRVDLDALARSTAEHIEALYDRPELRTRERRLELIEHHIRHVLALGERAWRQGGEP
jgi:hypothetical protein